MKLNGHKAKPPSSSDEPKPLPVPGEVTGPGWVASWNNRWVFVAGLDRQAYKARQIAALEFGRRTKTYVSDMDVRVEWRP
jgi:hypothetical protein